MKKVAGTYILLVRFRLTNGHLCQPGVFTLNQKQYSSPTFWKWNFSPSRDTPLLECNRALFALIPPYIAVTLPFYFLFSLFFLLFPPSFLSRISHLIFPPDDIGWYFFPPGGGGEMGYQYFTAANTSGSRGTVTIPQNRTIYLWKPQDVQPKQESPFPSAY
jgi:hypothetical protein